MKKKIKKIILGQKHTLNGKKFKRCIFLSVENLQIGFMYVIYIPKLWLFHYTYDPISMKFRGIKQKSIAYVIPTD